MIGNMKTNDIHDVVEIHIDSFPDSFLTQLGKPALKKLYEEFSQNGFGYVYRDDGKVAGFLAGTTTPVEKFYQDLIKKNILNFTFAIPVAVIQRPSVLNLIWIRINRLFRNPQYDSINTEPEYDLIQSSKGQIAYALTLGVAPQSRGKGIGKKLWNHLLHGLPNRGVEAILASVRSDNDITNNFYTKMGFKQIAQIKRKNYDTEFKWLAYMKDHCVVTETGKIEWND